MGNYLYSDSPTYLKKKKKSKSSKTYLYVRNQVAMAIAPPAIFCGIVWKNMMVHANITSLRMLINVIIQKMTRMYGVNCS